MNCPEPLAAALRQMAAGLPDGTNHYYVKANYYDRINSNQTRWWQAEMWLSDETARNLKLKADELLLEILLDGPQDLGCWTLIRVPYAEIWDIMHQRIEGSPTPSSWGKTLYHSFAVMRMPPVG